jgi:hypothetical protein
MLLLRARYPFVAAFVLAAGVLVLRYAALYADWLGRIS